RLPIPARIVVGLAIAGALHRIPIGFVAENIPCMVGNDIEYYVYSIRMSSLNEITQFFSRAEVRIDIQKVLNAVSVIARLGRNLEKDGAYPQRSHAQTLQIP